MHASTKYGSKRKNKREILISYRVGQGQSVGEGEMEDEEGETEGRRRGSTFFVCRAARLAATVD